MPFVRVDAYEGRSKEQVKNLLDAIHRAVLAAFGVPLRDRYQVYQEHPESSFIVQDTGLNIDRTQKVVFIGIIWSRTSASTSFASISTASRQSSRTACARVRRARTAKLTPAFERTLPAGSHS